MCEVALIAYGSNQRTAAGKLVQSSRPSPWEAPYRPLRPISSYALAAARHMHRYGTTKEQLGEVAIAARRWAQLNPEAFVREPLTMDDYLKARMVADPFNVRDCCLVTDGAAAVVMTRADRARDLCRRPAYLLGGAQNTTHREIASMADLTVTALAEAAPRAYAQAGVRPKDIDVVELYDAFTINTVLFLEDLGFCSKGEGGAFVAGGRIAPGGVLPVNTNGGGLSCVHPGMYGLFTMVEAARQLMGTCGERQVRRREAGDRAGQRRRAVAPGAADPRHADTPETLGATPAQLGGRWNSRRTRCSTTTPARTGASTTSSIATPSATRCCMRWAWALAATRCTAASCASSTKSSSRRCRRWPP